MKKNILATFALAALAAFTAVGGDANGNIRSIDAMPQSSKSIMFPNSTAPLKAGQQVYILVRLLNYDWVETMSGGVANHPWYFKPSAYATSSAMTALNTPALGISVGGVPRQAVYTSQGPDGQESGPNPTLGCQWYTDLYFVYTVQPGDIGLPIKLLNKNTKIPGTDSDNSDFLLYNVNTAGAEKYAVWDLTTDAEDDSGKNPLVQFHYGPDDPRDPGNKTPGYPTGQPHDEAHRSFDFSAEGVYIKTLDFDEDYEKKEDDIWREVQLGTDDPYTIDATIVGAVTGAVVYVWSEDDTVVQVTDRGDATYYDDGTGRKVVAVAIKEGKGTFGLKGAGGDTSIGKTVKIYMGASSSEGYSKVGDKLENSVCERTVKVREAPKPHITICKYASEETKFELKATTNYEAATVMKVMVSERFDNEPIEINLNPHFVRANEPIPLDVCDPLTNVYVCILAEENDPTLAVSTNRITIARGTATEAMFYLYALGAPADGTMNKLVLEPTIDDETTWNHYKEGKNKSATITLTDQAPVVTAPVAGASYNAFDGDVIPDFTIGIEDNWRDLQTGYNTNGYTVVVSFPNGGQSFTTNGVVFVDGGTVTLPVKAPAEGTYPAIITVKDPAGHTGTREVTVKAAHALEAKIKAYTDNTLTEEYPEGYVFKEGDMPYVRIELSSPASAPMFAFLRPVNDAATNLVSCSAVSNGLAIAQGGTASSAVAIQFLDGYSTLDPMRARFVVGLKSTDKFDAATAIDYTRTYAPREREFAVENVSPKIKAGSMRMSSTYVENGATLTAKAPANSPVTFTGNVADDSSVDLTATGDKAIIARWIYTDGVEGSKNDRVVFTTNTNRRVSCPITFREEGQLQTVKVYLLDKDDRAAQKEAVDLEDYDWGDPVYTFSVNVSQSATVNILDASGARVETMYYNETDAKSKAYFYVQLSTPPSDAGTAEGSRSISSANPLKVALYKEVWGSDGDLQFETNVIDVVDGNRVKVFFDQMSLNGGYDTYYQITAKVITDSCSNGYNQAWSDFYQPSSTEVMVYNIDPTISVVKRTNGSLTDVGTNRWSAGETIKLHWEVKDVIPDITNERFTVMWSIDSTDAAKYPNPLTITNGTPYTVTSTKFGTLKGDYEFQVPDLENQVLTLVIEDGDGGRVEKEWNIYVAQTKKLAVTPVGPGQTETKYARAAGLGIGHVYVDNSTGPSTAVIRDWIQTWNFAERLSQAGVTAEGYPASAVNAYDQGTLGVPDYKDAVPLSPTGGRGSVGNYFNYGKTTLDNFFYCWVTIGGENGTEILSPSPAKRSKTHIFDLDNEKPEDGGSYKTMQVEAIFSEEYLASDNMGDINRDGVPDVYAMNYPGLGVFDEMGNLTGNDLEDIGRQNVDEDYLPNTLTSAYASFIPGLAETWVMKGRAFTTKMEIRGADDNFNNAPALAGVKGVTPDVRYTNPMTDEKSTLSYLEYVAFTNWCGRQATPLEPADKGSWELWSPERPTKPTEADTDYDGLPDGYEYWFWYKAHVGELVVSTEDNHTVTNYMRMTGRRYNPASPCEPTIIPADEIEKIFDPIDGSGWNEDADTDNDGLPDVVEFEIGTNPIDYDTDGDGLPDGYEITRTETDPLRYATNGTGDARTNPDSDQMAMIEVQMQPVYFAFTNAVPGDFEASVAITNTYWLPVGDAAAAGFAEVPGHEGYTNFVKEVTFWSSWLYDVNPDRRALGRSDVVPPADSTKIVIFSVGEAVPLLAMHFQVQLFKPYDPRTGWNVPPIPEPPLRHTDSVAYTTWDEFQALAFFYQTGNLTLDDITPTPNRTWEQIWTECTTSPISADTDEDGMPDGWEFYVMGVGGPTSIYSPLYDFGRVTDPIARDPDLDGLDFLEEWMGTESMSRYGNCETIAKGLNGWTWKNKLWPTDPFNKDTDGDGILDGDERTWIFGDTPANMYGFVDGGGLNPLSWDTDADGLPDPWELEFCGTFGAQQVATAATAAPAAAGTNEVASADTTNATVAVAATTSVVFLNDGMNPTLNDAKRDYDHDGLVNWQEYMVGSMRCFRYDDTVSQWGTAFDVDLVEDLPDPNDEEAWGTFWYNILIDPVGIGLGETESSKVFNSNFAMGGDQFDAGMAYFSACNHDWDYNCIDPTSGLGKYYMFRDGVYHDLKEVPPNMYLEGGRQYNRFIWKLRNAPYSDTFDLFYPPPEDHVIYPKSYITCDPTMADSDGDGLDDYYELFHGLNPLLGASGIGGTVSKGKDGRKYTSPRDIVYQAYAIGDAPSAELNWWMFGDGAEGADHLEKTNARWIQPDSSGGYDFINFPWLAGLPNADPDGDDARNYEESIQANIQAASTYFHTDPTPLWMTDTSYADSLTTRYYNSVAGAGALLQDFTKDSFTYTNPYTHEKETRYFNDFPCLTFDANNHWLIIQYLGLNNFGLVPGSTQFDFEENEGYDSDHDFLSDTAERTGITKAASDPQDHDDPIRRQPMWFGGARNPGFLETPLMVDEAPSADEGNSESRENFKFFTAECWAKPDADTYDKEGYQIVLERSVYTGVAGPADSSFVRKNFIIGLRDGRWFAGFDCAGTALDRIEITDGPIASTNWTYLAATYEGTTLTLYVGADNDFQAYTKTVGRHPEHGLMAPMFDVNGELIGVDSPLYTTIVGSPCIAIMVGGSIKTLYGHKFDYYDPMDHWTNIDDYGDFYCGYVDEVRLWDGARGKDDLEADYRNRIRYTAAKALENRQAVYDKWSQGATRAENNVAGTLPPQLRYHWAFDHLAGAREANQVMRTPAGFTMSSELPDAKAYWCRPPDWVNTWRAGFHDSIKSTVYTDEAYIPWINDTVSHLPRFDGTTVDSCYWTENTVGNMTANSLGYAKFGFNRTHEVWSKWMQMAYAGGAPATTPTRWDNLKSLGSEILPRVNFTFRNSHTYGDDMLPFGSAYPRRISSIESGGLWDDCGAADAWAQTGYDGDGDDDDNDGLPTWWENIAFNDYDAKVDPATMDVTWTTPVVWNGIELTAGEAYLRDLARGMLPDGEYHIEYADTRDSDKDGVIDFYAEAYNLMDGHAGEDDDGDGLSNYAEYLITEVFKYAKCDPKQYATDRKTCDYFLKVGELYLGEIFTDHDQMNDVWEARYDADYVNRGVFDPFADPDGDGWSNYAEFRASTDPTTKNALSIDGYVCPEYPVPAIAANIIYNGETVIRHPLVVKAWNETTDYDMLKAPDAMWTLGTAESTASQDGGTQSSANTQGSALQQHEKFLGRKPTGEKTFYLSGGHVSEGSVKLLFLDKGYGTVQYDPVTDLIYPVGVGRPEDAKWYYFIIDKGGKLVRAGGSLFAAMGEEEVVVGTIDYISGRVTIDFGHEELSGPMLGDPSMSETDGDEKENTTTTRAANTYDYVDLDTSYVRVEWQASSVQAVGEGLHYLSDPDPVADTALSFGHLREGKNTFVCFVDEDGNGEYTAGELFGVVRGVDVGWSGASFDLELTATHPIFARCDLTGNNDRSVWYGVDSGNLSTDVNEDTAGDTTGTTGGEGETLSNGGKKMHVRVDRYAINGMKIGLDVQKELLIQYNRVLFDKWLSVGARTYLHEGDFMNEKNDEFDIDWAHFDEISDDAAVLLKFGGEVQSVTYRVVVDNSDFVHPIASNKVLSVAFTRVFDNSNARTKATDLTLDPAGIVYGARPTFRWSMKMASGKVNNSYTAFKIRVYEANGTTVVYESPMTFVPPMDAKGYYEWKAPFSVGDQTSLGKVFERVGNYKWSVSMYNAKFQTDAYCEPVAFSTAVSAQQLTDDHGYGAVKVAVKYAGPADVLSKAGKTSTTAGMVRVQAFANADFAGVPECQTFATNVAAIRNTTDLTANATLYGLKAGTYYIRAYVDSDGDFTKDDWESWGYAKAAVTVVSGRMPETATVWIEDADTDGDWIPDAYEYAKHGNLMTENAMVDPNGKIILKTATYAAVKNGYASISSSLPGASLTLFENLDAAKLLLGLGNDTTTSTIDAIREAIATRINPGSVKITQLSMNVPMRMVTMSVAASAQEPPTASFYSAVYSVPDATTVTIEVYRAEDLNGEWKLVDTKQVLVNSALEATFEIPVNADCPSGYYRVVVVE